MLGQTAAMNDALSRCRGHGRYAEQGAGGVRLRDLRGAVIRRRLRPVWRPPTDPGLRAAAATGMFGLDPERVGR
jgi:hypothetical protein